MNQLGHSRSADKVDGGHAGRGGTVTMRNDALESNSKREHAIAGNADILTYII